MQIHVHLSMYFNLCWHSWLHSASGKCPTGFMFDIQSSVGTSHVFWQRFFSAKAGSFFRQRYIYVVLVWQVFWFSYNEFRHISLSFLFLSVINLFYHIFHRSLDFQSYFHYNPISNYQTKSLFSAIFQTLLWSNISP